MVKIEFGELIYVIPLALELVQAKRDITIITNSAFIADYVRKSGNVKIILLGGEYQNE